MPSLSALSRIVEAVYYQDSYCAPLLERDLDLPDIFQAIFAHHPTWIKISLIVRNRIVRSFGLDAASDAEIFNFTPKSSYSVGDKIGIWPIFVLTDTELIVGRDNRHLDFRLSILKITDTNPAMVIVTTICQVHNLFGKLYLFFVVPFHKWGVKKILSNAVVNKRL